MNGYLYLIHLSNDEDDLFKVGRTINFKNRMDQYKSLNRGNVEILRKVQVEDSFTCERELHRLLRKNYQCDGNLKSGIITEWYFADKNEICKDFDNYINAISSR